MSGIEPPGGRQHIPALDGLRGVAVAAVVLYHLGYLKGGFLGVDLFFVLSGYLITSLLVSEWVAHGRISLAAFWARRARRLLPALLLVLAGVAIYAALGAEAVDRARIRTDGLAALFYVANWHQIATKTNYFDVFQSKSPLEHMWSLAIEEQFYLVWPLIALVTLGRRKRHANPDSGLARLFVVCIALAAASVATTVVLFVHSHSVDRVYYGTDTRAGAILMGAALAVGHQRWGRAVRVGIAEVLDVVAIVFIGAIAVTWALANGTSPTLWEGGLTLIGLAVCVLMAALVTPTPGLLGTILSFAPLRALGRISYGVYLWHWPVIVALTADRTHLNGVSLSVVRVAVTLAIALASYRFVEQPIRHGALRGRIALSYAGMGAVACALLLFISTTADTSPLSAEIARARAHPGELVVATDPPTTEPVAGTTPEPPIETLVVGDSGAYYLGAGMARVQSSYDRTIVNRGTVGCGVARGDGRLRLPDGRILKDTAGCDQYLLRWTLYVHAYHPKRVILLLADVGGGDRFVQGHWIGDCDPQFDAFFQYEVAQGIHTLQELGAKVTITTIPDIATEQPASAARKVDCRNFALQAAAASLGAQVIDLRHWACPSPDRCVLHKDGVDLRPDRVHFLGAGADIAARWVLDQVKG